MLGFYIQTYKDEHLLKQVIRSIKTHHPDALTFVLYNRYTPKEVIGDHIQFYTGEHPYHSAKRAALIPHNWISWLLSFREVEWFFKIDTDSLIISPMMELYPNCLMCSVCEGWYPQGGCYGFDRSVAKRLVSASNSILHDPPPRRVYREKREGWVAEDRYFGHLASISNVGLKNSGMIYCRSKADGFIRNHPTASVIHPVEEFVTRRILML